MTASIREKQQGRPLSDLNAKLPALDTVACVMAFDFAYRHEVTVDMKSSFKTWMDVYGALYQQKVTHAYWLSNYGIVGKDDQFVLLDQIQFATLLHAEYALHRK